MEDNNLKALSSKELSVIYGGQAEGSYENGFGLGALLRKAFQDLIDAIPDMPDGIYSGPKY